MLRAGTQTCPFGWHAVFREVRLWRVPCHAKLAGDAKNSLRSGSDAFDWNPKMVVRLFLSLLVQEKKH